MSDSKSKSNSQRTISFGASWPVRWLRQLRASVQVIPRTAIASMLGPTILLLAGYLGWTYYGAQHFDRSYHSLAIDSIHITPQPSWIKQPVLEQVFNKGGLKDLSALDRHTTPLIAHAFEIHPWVRSVKRVMKRADGGIQVDIEYRKPVALVYYDPPTSSPAAQSTANGPSKNGYDNKYLPIDGDGFLLPTDDFKDEPRQQLFERFIWIFAKNAYPPRMFSNTSFGDPRIVQAAKLCQYLEPHRSELQIVRIDVEQDRQSAGANLSLMEVGLANDRKFSWGHAPGMEISGEPSADVKLQSLKEQNSTSRPKQPR